MPDPARVRLEGRFTVALPAEETLNLFTPRGERTWAPGWDPRFAAGEPVDDGEPGVAFSTAHGPDVTTWLVVEREPSARIAYARVTPGVSAGLVSVDCAPAGEAASEVTVRYDLTALSERGRHHLARFAAGYTAFLAGWERAIAALANA